MLDAALGVGLGAFVGGDSVIALLDGSQALGGGEQGPVEIGEVIGAFLERRRLASLRPGSCLEAGPEVHEFIGLIATALLAALLGLQRLDASGADGG